MDIIRDRKARPLHEKIISMACLVLIGVALNVGGSFLADTTGIPLYLDCIGTILTAMLGGYIPGILTGIVGPVINSFTDPVSISYMLLNVLIAVVTVLFKNRGWFRKASKIGLSILIYAFIGGVMGAFLNWNLYGYQGESVSLPFVEAISSFLHIGKIPSIIIGDYVIDVADKAISLLAALLIYSYIPEPERGRFAFNIWMQEPLTDGALKELSKRRSRFLSLRAKIVLLLLAACTTTSFASISISYYLHSSFVHEQFGSSIDNSLNPSFISGYTKTFLVSHLALFLGLFILIFVVGLSFAEYYTILPLNAMAYTVSMYSEENEADLKGTADALEGLGIHTGDEIENLYHAFSNMTASNLAFVTDMNTKNEMISGMQNSLIMVLADMVESRDRSTGNHIMKTGEYTRIIMDELVKEGLFSDVLTEAYMEDVYKSAPLHDIGKISIPDNILNKPGKLTLDEYEIMKTHAGVGAGIIDKVIDTVPGADGEYLKEAKNLAFYHHEKWDGTGYPMGLAGENIPLSARIMAVADVFDALVSERSYKKAYPFEKAIGIIKDSIGTHFDPRVANAFLAAREKVRAVAESGDNSVKWGEY